MAAQEREERNILEAIRQGTAPAIIKRRASRGTAPVSSDELLEILVLLTRDPDPTCSEVAKATLSGWPPEKCAQLLAEPLIGADTLAYFSAQPDLLDIVANTIATHPHADDRALAPLAPRLSLEQIEQIVANQEHLAAMPQLAAALLQRADLPADLRSRLEATHPGLTPPQEEKQAEPENEPSAAPAQGAGAEAQAAPEEERLRVSLTQKIASMGVSERVQFALKGDREARMILIRDPNKVVYRAVLQSPRLTDMEVESFASLKNVADEVLRLIAGMRKFIKNYAVVRNLINNPRTPIDVSLPMLNRLTNKDLKFLTMNRNVAETLRNMAMRLHQQRITTRK